MNDPRETFLAHRRRNRLAATEAASRAGEIVREQVGSIIEAAESSAAETRRSAEEQAARTRREANEAAAHVLGRFDAIERNLSEVVATLRLESDNLNTILARRQAQPADREAASPPEGQGGEPSRLGSGGPEDRSPGETAVIEPAAEEGPPVESPARADSSPEYAQPGAATLDESESTEATAGPVEEPAAEAAEEPATEARADLRPEAGEPSEPQWSPADSEPAGPPVDADFDAPAAPAPPAPAGGADADRVAEEPEAVAAEEEVEEPPAEVEEEAVEAEGADGQPPSFGVAEAPGDVSSTDDLASQSDETLADTFNVATAAFEQASAQGDIEKAGEWSEVARALVEEAARRPRFGESEEHGGLAGRIRRRRQGRRMERLIEARRAALEEQAGGHERYQE